MGEFNVRKAPFPYFGGKSRAADAVWALFGDVNHYVEPFAGSLAVLLGRPHEPNRPYFSETVNDLDCLLVNAWRAIQFAPEETAHYASWPVTEADKMARQIAMVRWRETDSANHIRGTHDWYDARMAGWWLWGVCISIGATWCNGGPWTADSDGHAYRQQRAANEPGVTAVRPHLVDNGRGVVRPGLREPGVRAARPHLVGNGQGVVHGGLRERGVTAAHLAVMPTVPYNLDPGGFHPMTMPKLIEWFGWLSARLRHVRIVNGDWRRVVTPAASKTLPVRQGDGICGVFLDPPYDNDVRAKNVYVHDDGSVASDVREWAIANGDDPDYRIVVAGFEAEHADQFAAAGWTSHEWFTVGYLTGGMAQRDPTKAGVGNQDQERLWASPHCLTGQAADPQPSLFDLEGTS